MKKLLITLTLIFTLCLSAFTLTACQEPHAHTYSQSYNFDKTHHWQDATCGCNLKQNYGEHTLGNLGNCTICDEPINPTEGVLYDYSSDGTYIEVLGYEGTSKKVKIADTYDNLPVKTIYAEAFKGTSITRIEIPESVTSIGNNTFKECYPLTSVTFGENSQLTSIGDEAFYGCSSLTSIDIPASVRNIGESAFQYCTSLTRIEISASVTSIGESAFYRCTSLTSIDIPESVTSIGNNTFKECYSLTSVTFGENSQLTSIGDEAFYNCVSLEAIEMPASVRNIGERAFQYCISLTNIVLPDSVINIGFDAFSGCNSSLYSTEKSIKYVKVNRNPYYILIGVTNKNLSTYIINSQTKYIGYNAFSGCARLSNIVIPESVTSIGYLAFCSCASLTSVVFEKTNSWWRASSSTATGGRLFLNSDLSNTSTAATYLKSTYCDYCWKRTWF